MNAHGYLAVNDGDKQPWDTDPRNLEFLDREERFTGSTPNEPIVTLIGFLPLDFSTMNRLIPNRSELTFDLLRQSDEFLIFGGTGDKYNIPDNTTYKILVEDLNLYIKRPLVTGATYARHEKMFAEDKLARFYFWGNETVRFTVPQGVTTYTSLPIITKTLHPTKVFVVFCPEKALVGSFDSNPLDFAPPPNLTKASLVLDGHDVFGLDDLVGIDRDTGLDEINYAKLMMTCQNFGSNSNPLKISLGQFKTSYYILSADLTSNSTVTADKLNLLRQGNLNVQIKFSEGLDQAWVIIVWTLSSQLMRYAPAGIPAMTEETPGPAVLK